MSGRIYPKAYLPAHQIVTDYRRNYLSGVQAAFHDSLILRIASAPDARLPNDPVMLAGLLRTSTEETATLIGLCMQHGLLSVLSDNSTEWITTQYLQDWYANALTVSATNSENAKKKRKKRDKAKPKIETISAS